MLCEDFLCDLGKVLGSGLLCYLLLKYLHNFNTVLLHCGVHLSGWGLLRTFSEVTHGFK